MRIRLAVATVLIVAGASATAYADATPPPNPYAGPAFDTMQMVGAILPDGTLPQGTLTGSVVVRPRL